MDQRYEYRAEYLRALAHPVRLQILDLLREGEMCVCCIVAALNKEQAYVSGQLSVLRGSMLVRCHRRGRKAYYGLADPLLTELLSLIFGPSMPRGAGHSPPSSTPRPD
ncbi:MAG: helix-turn-helix transcriptional regulator [Anaerolineae bacterium]|nr:helix-turn-helix transcriptional regulator [Anaerolineae bacterium]